MIVFGSQDHLDVSGEEEGLSQEDVGYLSQLLFVPSHNSSLKSLLTNTTDYESSSRAFVRYWHHLMTFDPRIAGEIPNDFPLQYKTSGGAPTRAHPGILLQALPPHVQASYEEDTGWIERIFSVNTMMQPFDQLSPMLQFPSSAGEYLESTLQDTLNETYVHHDPFDDFMMKTEYNQPVVESWLLKASFTSKDIERLFYKYLNQEVVDFYLC